METMMLSGLACPLDFNKVYIPYHNIHIPYHTISYSQYASDFIHPHSTRNMTLVLKGKTTNLPFHSAFALQCDLEH